MSSSAAAWFLGSRVRIPLTAWMLVSCVCCVYVASSVGSWSLFREALPVVCVFLILCDLEHLKNEAVQEQFEVLATEIMYIIFPLRLFILSWRWDTEISWIFGDFISKWMASGILINYSCLELIILRGLTPSLSDSGGTWGTVQVCVSVLF